MPVQHSPVPTRKKPAAPPGTPASGVVASDMSPEVHLCANLSLRDTEVKKTVEKAGKEADRDEEDGDGDTEISPSNVRGKPVGKLGKGAYKPWGTCSRSSSDTGSEGTGTSGGGPAICKGGPGNVSCDAPVTDSDNGVQCDICGDWFHAKCQQVSRYAFNALEKYISTLSWLCYDCKRALKETKTKKCQCTELTSKLDMLVQMQDKINTISDVLQKQENIILDHGRLLEKSQDDARERKASYAEALKGSCAEVVERVSSKLDALPTGRARHSSVTTEQAVAGMLHSFMDKDRRKYNLVAYNVPENREGDASARNKHDTTTFISIVKNCLDIDVTVTKSFRAGRVMTERPRPLVLTLDSVDCKTEILENAYKLSHFNEWKKVYLAPDRTPKEREENKKLREELQRRKQDGEEDIVIRKGKIVKKAMSEHHGGRQTGVPIRPESTPTENQDIVSIVQRQEAEEDCGGQGVPRHPQRPQ